LDKQGGAATPPNKKPGGKKMLKMPYFRDEQVLYQGQLMTVFNRSFNDRYTLMDSKGSFIFSVNPEEIKTYKGAAAE
jgi:hypothetical protein